MISGVGSVVWMVVRSGGRVIGGVVDGELLVSWIVGGGGGCGGRVIGGVVDGGLLVSCGCRWVVVGILVVW